MEELYFLLKENEEKKTIGFSLVSSIKKKSRCYVRSLVEKIVWNEVSVEVEGDRIKFRESKTGDYVVGFELSVLELDPLKKLIQKQRLIIRESGVLKKRFDFIYV